MGKRITGGVVVIMVVASTLALAVGCGGDTKKAKQYIDKAESILDELREDEEKLQQYLTKLFNDLATEQVTSSARAEELALELQEVSARLLEESQRARVEFEKVQGLEGVDDYKEYAGLRIEAIDDMTEFLGLASGYLAYLEKTLAAAEAGQPVDQQQVKREASSFMEQVMVLQTELEETRKKIEEMSDRID